MESRETQGQMLCGVHLPHGLRAKEHSLDSVIKVTVLVILIRCQKRICRDIVDL